MKFTPIIYISLLYFNLYLDQQVYTYTSNLHCDYQQSIYVFRKMVTVMPLTPNKHWRKIFLRVKKKPLN